MRVRWAIAILAAALLVGCSAKEEMASDSAKADVGAMPNAASSGEGVMADRKTTTTLAESATTPIAPAGGALPKVVPAVVTQRQRSVIRKASLVVRVDNVEKAEKAANEVIAKIDGYVEGTESNDLSSSEAQITMKVRVPVGAFDYSIASFERLGVRTKKQISGDDVTAKVLDYGARLKVMRAQEEVYRNLLKNSRRLDDAMSIQQQLMQLRENIEGMSAQLKGLNELASLSTIELTLTQSREATANLPSDRGWFGESWAGAKSAAFSFYRGVVVILMWLLLFSPVWLGAVLLVRWGAKATAKTAEEAKAKQTVPPPAPPRMDL